MKRFSPRAKIKALLDKKKKKRKKDNGSYGDRYYPGDAGFNEGNNPGQGG